MFQIGNQLVWFVLSAVLVYIMVVAWFRSGRMSKPNEGTRRLSVALGMVMTIPPTFLLFIGGGPVMMILIVLSYFAGWSTVQLGWWVWEGYRDHE